MRVAQTAARALRLGPRELITTAYAGALVVIVEIMVRRMKLTSISSIIGVRLDLSPRDQHLQPVQLERLPESTRRRLRCAARVADRWPLSQGPCLRRSLVGAWMIRSRHPTLCLGLDELDGAVIGHAWLELDGRPIEDVSSIGRFVDDAARSAR